MIEHDIVLNYQSISLVDGHAGSEVKYIAADRKVVNSSFCVKKTKKLFRTKMETTTNVEELPIPDCIQTEDELKDYIRKNRRSWLM